MPAERFDFVNAQGEKLAALLDRPDGPIRAVALFAHDFAHEFATGGIEPGSRLIQKQDVGLIDHCLGEANPLHHAL